MKTIHVKPLATRALRGGRQLIMADDLTQPIHGEPGESVRVNGNDNQFIGMAYLGEQHKGVGWLYSEVADQPLDEALLIEKLETAKAKRQALMNDPQTTGYRLFNGDGDGLGGLLLDWYDGYIVSQWYSEGIVRYRKAIVQTVQHVFPECRGMVAKNRFQSDNMSASEWLYGEPSLADWSIKENGVSYMTHLDEGWMTGIFFDQRDVRGYLMTQLAPGKRVLNTFSYAGAFSIAAAMGGATETISVDIAQRTRELFDEQLALNHLSPEAHRVYTMDTFDYLDYAARHEEMFDVIIMDPPSFARTKKNYFKVSEHYPKLIEKALPLLSHGGHLIASTNAANFKRADFRQALERGIQASDCRATLGDEFRLPFDFPVPPHSPESDYLKVTVIEKKGES